MFKSELIGTTVSLYKLNEALATELASICMDPELWAYYIKSEVDMPDFVDSYIQKALENTANGTYYTYVVIRNSDNKIVGSTRYYDIAPSDQRVAIGFTFYTQDAQGTGVNGECKSLLLNQAFDTVFNRVEFHVDSFCAIRLC